MLVVGLALVCATGYAEDDTFPRYKPSSRSPEAIDIRTNAYGFSQSAPNALRISDIAPDFEVLSPDEKTISSRELREQGPLVIVFYRGHW